MPEKLIRKIAFAGVTGSLYAALTISLSFIGFGPVQLRIAEALCVLPFFVPFSAWGLFAGCIISNLLSPYTLDIIVGPAATLLAALCTMRIGMSKRSGTVHRVIACIPPVVINALFIGALIAFYMTSGGDAGNTQTFLSAFIVCGLQVGLGEAVVMFAAGLPLLIYLPKSRLFSRTLAGITGK